MRITTTKITYLLNIWKNDTIWISSLVKFIQKKKQLTAALWMNEMNNLISLKWKCNENAREKGIEINTKLISGLKAQAIPLQTNNSDCGLYLLAYIEKFAQNPDWFISRLLRKDMDLQTDWPPLTSSDLRLRMSKFLTDLRDEQVQFSHGQKQGELMADRWPVSFLLGETNQTTI